MSLYLHLRNPPESYFGNCLWSCLLIHARILTIYQPPGYSVGDMKEWKFARIFWKLAKVEEQMRSNDNVVRWAKIQVLNNETWQHVSLGRPSQHLIAIEVWAQHVTKNTETLDMANEEPSDKMRVRRRRNAAVLGDTSHKIHFETFIRLIHTYLIFWKNVMVNQGILIIMLNI